MLYCMSRRAYLLSCPPKSGHLAALDESQKSAAVLGSAQRAQIIFLAADEVKSGASFSSPRVRRAKNPQPHLLETFKLSRDSRFVDNLMDIVGPYLSRQTKRWCRA